MEWAIELRGLRKTFGATVANADISLGVRAGTIHAIIGENGAGKSTAMKMLYGMYCPDAGEIRVNGRPVQWSSPRDAIRAGIGMVHQHFMLAGPYRAIENVVLGHETPRAWVAWDEAGARRKLERLVQENGMKVDWDAPVESLSVGEQQRLEILKLLYQDASVLILDEPTAVLTPQETDELFVQLRRLRDRGKTILIITHKLKEVMRLADCATVFRAGRVVGEREIAATSASELADLMVGRSIDLTAQAPAAKAVGAVRLRIQNLRLAGALRGLSLEVRAGEIVGVAGVEGNGQTELVHAIVNRRDFGSQLTGQIELDGQALEVRSSELGLIPADRHREGLLLDRSAAENLLLGRSRERGLSHRGWLKLGVLAQLARRLFAQFDIRPQDPNLAIRGFSGGNQQKVIVARELDREPKVLIAAQPTRGVDIGAIEFIHQQIVAARDRGCAVLLVSSELDEIRALSDRIVVLYEGAIAGEFARGQADEQTLGLRMGGSR